MFNERLWTEDFGKILRKKLKFKFSFFAALNGNNSTYLFIKFKRCELYSSIRKDPHHLSAIALVKCDVRFLLDNVHQTTKHSVMFVMCLMCLQENLYPIEWRHCRLWAHSGDAWNILKLKFLSQKCGTTSKIPFEWVIKPTDYVNVFSSHKLHLRLAFSRSSNNERTLILRSIFMNFTLLLFKLLFYFQLRLVDQWMR